MIAEPILRPDQASFDAAYANEQIRRSRHPWRRFIKGFYLRSVLKQVQGCTIDYGCGAGQLLRQLPPGSLGLEVNPHLIALHQQEGLPVQSCTNEASGFDLIGLPANHFDSLVISHVLEHLPDPDTALQRLLKACTRLGIQRVVVIVPGQRGQASDPTHRCLIDPAYVKSHGWSSLANWQLRRQAHFPLPWAWGGAVWTYNEMQLCFDGAGA